MSQKQHGHVLTFMVCGTPLPFGCWKPVHRVVTASTGTCWLYPTYLGHSRITDTYWYLEATAQLMVDIADACERFTKGDKP